MSGKYIGFFLLLIIISFRQKVMAQHIDNYSVFKTIQQDKYIQLHFDNDFFINTDYYYTQGVTLEYVKPGLKNFFLTKLLIQPRNTIRQYGISINSFVYTPTDISSNNVLYGDRPFASCISVKSFLLSTDSIRKQRLTTAISVGVVGPVALGKEIQSILHRWIYDVLPKGWQYQVQNDLLLNYQLNYEKQLLNAPEHFLLDATAEARLGTLNDKLSGGLNFMAGSFSDPFRWSGANKKMIKCYLYGQALVNFIGYDATLQGGIFNRGNPYTITNDDISRITFQAMAGIVLNVKNITLSYSQSYLTKEFSTGIYHRWGGLNLGYSF